MTDDVLIPDLNTFDVESAGKDELESVSKFHLGTDIDKRKSLEFLRNQVRDLMASHSLKNQAVIEKTEKAQEAGYLKNSGTGAVFPFAKLLAKRADMIPCDKDGNPV